jgi:hypothetical protein
MLDIYRVLICTCIHLYMIYTLIKGLSDHDTQLLKANKVQKQEKEYHTYFQRKINNIP